MEKRKKCSKCNGEMLRMIVSTKDPEIKELWECPNCGLREAVVESKKKKLLKG